VVVCVEVVIDALDELVLVEALDVVTNGVSVVVVDDDELVVAGVGRPTAVCRSRRVVAPTRTTRRR